MATDTLRRAWQAIAARYPTLTAQELAALTAYKRVYRLECAGFSPAEARRLLFVAWCYQRGVVGR